ncbi:hypothetical protein AMTR_s00028p00047100 [Amborella trichopoda]|uniref:Uncharacterized protein n=1 Tax=Amborella trichopoda TaxID=13333 RepID=W1PR71_AMBTC|nr:hypothetical protein AMTR_s00028p00047100 [Amborella trichopoda]
MADEPKDYAAKFSDIGMDFNVPVARVLDTIKERVRAEKLNGASGVVISDDFVEPELALGVVISDDVTEPELASGMVIFDDVVA